MPPTPVQAEIIGQRANQRVGDCVDNARNQKHDTAQIGTYAEHLIVKHHRHDARGADGGLLKRPRREGNLVFYRYLEVTLGHGLSSGRRCASSNWLSWQRNRRVLKPARLRNPLAAASLVRCPQLKKPRKVCSWVMHVPSSLSHCKLTIAIMLLVPVPFIRVATTAWPWASNPRVWQLPSVAFQFVAPDSSACQVKL